MQVEMEILFFDDSYNKNHLLVFSIISYSIKRKCKRLRVNDRNSYNTANSFFLAGPKDPWYRLVCVFSLFSRTSGLMHTRAHSYTVVYQSCTRWFHPIRTLNLVFSSFSLPSRVDICLLYASYSCEIYKCYSVSYKF